MAVLEFNRQNAKVKSQKLRSRHTADQAASIFLTKQKSHPP
jgi:hypothetical protein